MPGGDDGWALVPESTVIELGEEQQPVEAAPVEAPPVVPAPEWASLRSYAEYNQIKLSACVAFRVLTPANSKYNTR